VSTDYEIVEEGLELPQGTAVQRRAEQGAAVAPSDEVTGLVRLAIEQGVSVDILERLVALQERVTERNARGAFFAAKSAFQAECPEIRKSRKADIVTKSGSRFAYTYAPLEEITRTILPVLARHGLSFTWDVADVQGKMLNVSCVLRHVDGHEDRATFPVPVETGGRMSDAQAMGGALTYGRRQSLIAVLGLTTADEDTDAAQRQPQTVSTITREQMADLEVLIAEVGADLPKFLEWAGVADLASLPASKLPRAIQLLEKRRAQ
jgi:hypothetical protein